jgi:hypothetical protein
VVSLATAVGRREANETDLLADLLELSVDREHHIVRRMRRRVHQDDDLVRRPTEPEPHQVVRHRLPVRKGDELSATA